MSLQESDIEQNIAEATASSSILNDDQSLESTTLTNSEGEPAGIEFTAAELAYVRKLVADRITQLKNRISIIDRSLQGHTAANTLNAEVEVLGLNEELDFLERDFSKKLYVNSPESDHSSDINKYIIGFEANRAIGIHDQPDYALDPTELAMRKEEHTGVELSDKELSYMKKLVKGRMTELPRDIVALDRSLSGRTAYNGPNTRDEKEKAKGELNFLKHNLGEKLFANDTDANEDMWKSS